MADEKSDKPAKGAAATAEGKGKGKGSPGGGEDAAAAPRTPPAGEEKKAKAPKGAGGGKAPGGGGGGKATVSFKAKPKKKATGKPEQPLPTPRLLTHYRDTVKPALKKSLGRTADLAVPRITKVVVSMGIGDAHENPRKLEALVEDLETVTGQHPVVTRSRMSVANFKLRKGMAVGTKVTLRRWRMWEFLDRLISLVIPRMRDFRGLNAKSFDRRGNYNFGLPDQLVFPEIRADKVEFMNGMNIVACTTAANDDEARQLLRLMGFPFQGEPVVVLGGKEG